MVLHFLSQEWRLSLYIIRVYCLCAADLRTLAKLIPAESRLVIEPAKRAEDAPKALEVVGVHTSSIRQGDVLRVLPGERVPVDGEIVEGRCSLDESMLTGESALVNKAEGAQASTQDLTRRQAFPWQVSHLVDSVG